MTGLQLALGFGAMLGLGIIMLVAALAPADPELGAAFQAMEPAPPRPTTVGPVGLQTRVGLWAAERPTITRATRVPAADFAILGVDPIAHTGRKLLAASYGLFFPTIANLVLAAVGVTLPWAIPAIAGLGVGALFFTIPDGALRDRATTARADFVRALGAYTDLVSLERRAGAGTTAAMESAAASADNPTFNRIRESLAASRWAGTTPWDGIAALAEDIGVPQLGDLAGIMRMSGEQSTSVAETLKARSESLRTAISEDEHAAANAAGERMWIAGALLAVIYLTMLAAPAVIRVITNT